jgi:DNA-binding transcriptional regulator YhcF (GntR family)
VLLGIDAASSVPPYEQIRTAIATQARSGALPAGTRLPTVRKLADDLGVAPGTVARAYKELEADLVVETRGRHGTFVSADRDALAREAFAAAVEYVHRVRRLGIADDVAIAYVTSALESAP